MPDRPKAPTAAWLNQQKRRADAHVDAVTPLLEAALTDALTDLGRVAAAGFTARATALTAAAPPSVGPAGTMIAVKPTPAQAAALALEGGEPADTLHVTLVYLGQTIGPLNAVVDALRPVALTHAPLAGLVGGIGSFTDLGDGYPVLALPDVPGLVELRVAVTEALVRHGVGYARNHGYCPHMTLAYRPAPRFAAEAAGVPLTFNDLLIVRGDTEVIPLALSGQPPLTAAADPFVEDLTRAMLEPVNDEPTAVLTNVMRASDARVYDGLLPSFLPSRSRLTVTNDATVWELDHGSLSWAETARWGELASMPSLFDRIRAVAEEHRPEGGYGETWYRDGIPDGSGGTTYSKGCTVFWTCADWSTNDEILAAEAAFLAIDGVGHFDYDAEGYPTAWRQVYSRPSDRLAVGSAIYQRFAQGDPPPFIPPGADEILDVDAVIARITARIKPVRDAAIEAVVTPIVNSVGIAFDVTNPLVSEVLSQVGSQVTEIAETTQLNVMRTVRAAYQEGLSIPDTAAAIQEGMADAAPARARLIARTELSGAVNGGSLAAVRVVEGATGVTYHKVWMTAPGAKHPRHYLYDGLNGQTRKLAEKFLVGGYELDHPGDPEGPPGEVCNCRCALRYGEGEPPADGL